MDSRDLRIVFAGTPEFAARHLEALIAGSFNVVSAYSQPDRPSGRGKLLLPTPVKAVALANGIKVHQPLSLNNPEACQILAEAKADVMVVVAYGLLLPEAILALPRFGCLNVHASLLPRWRGAAPIERALMAADAESGVSLMQMDKGLDSGSVLKRITTPILPEDNSQTLGLRLCELGCKALCESLQNLPLLLQHAEPQDEHQVTYASKISKTEALLDWQLPVKQLHNQIRAMYPRAPAFCYINQKRLRVIASRTVDENPSAEAGTVISCNSDGVKVACGDGVLQILRVQLEGKSETDIASLLNGHPDFLKPGMQLGPS